jgi:hypothetical protein
VISIPKVGRPRKDPVYGTKKPLLDLRIFPDIALANAA